METFEGKQASNKHYETKGGIGMKRWIVLLCLLILCLLLSSISCLLLCTVSCLLLCTICCLLLLILLFK